jgi:hypothetical protein
VGAEEATGGTRTSPLKRSSSSTPPRLERTAARLKQEHESGWAETLLSFARLSLALGWKVKDSVPERSSSHLSNV